MSESNISGIVVTGLMAVLGTVAGSVIKGYWDTSLAEKDFQSKLILRALEPSNPSERITSLSFLIKTNLISDPAVREGVSVVLKEGEKSIPQFRPVNVSTNMGGLGSVSSAREQLLEKFPTLKGKPVALVGFRVRHGDIIDAVTPIFAEVTPQMVLNGEYDGNRIGGSGGGESILKKPGYVVTGFDVYRGEYFGRTEVIQFQVIWTRLSKNGLEGSDTVLSEKVGSGNYAKPLAEPTKFRADKDAFISDFKATVSLHTSGETFLNDIQTSQTVVTSPK